MSLSTSLAAFRETIKENRQFRQMGAGSYDLLRLHYRGRLEDRFRLKPKDFSFRFRHFDRLVDLRMSAPYLGAFKGVFLDHEYDCTKLLETPPKRILDLGANIGMGTISLACQFPDAEFICVEPDPRNVKLLNHNLKKNNIEANVIVSAVGPRAGRTKLRFNANPTCSRLEYLDEQDLNQLTDTELVNIPGIKNKVGWSSIDLVKIDIEGAEEDLLREENSWLTDAKAIILEIHPNTTPELISNYLSPFGFTLSKIPNTREPVFFAAR